MPETGDCLVDEKYLFEIGGKKKSYKQIKDIQYSYVVADDIEVGMGNKVLCGYSASCIEQISFQIRFWMNNFHIGNAIN